MKKVFLIALLIAAIASFSAGIVIANECFRIRGLM